MSKPIRPAIEHHDAMRMYLFGNITEICLASPSASVIYAAVAFGRPVASVSILAKAVWGPLSRAVYSSGTRLAIDLRLRRPLYRRQNPRIPGPVLNGLAAASSAITHLVVLGLGHDKHRLQAGSEWRMKGLMI